MRHLLAFLPGLILSISCYCQSVGNITLHQLDWYDENGDLQIEHSDWGLFEIHVTPHPTDTFYFNVSSTGTNAQWLVKNFPILPLTIEQPQRWGMDIDLSLLGFPRGSKIYDFPFEYSFDSSIIPSHTTGIFGYIPVDSLARISFGSRLNGPTLPADIGHPAGINILSPILKTIVHDSVQRVQEATNQCLPGSLARSIKWLGDQYGFADSLTAQNIYDSLIQFDVPTRLSYEAFVSKKDSLLKSYDSRASTKILDLTGIIGNVPNVPQETGTDVLDFLERELPKCDVELHYDTHIITVTGLIILSDSTIYLRYRDDETQGNNAVGDTSVKTALLHKDSLDRYFFRRDSTAPFLRVQALLAECVDTNGTWINLPKDIYDLNIFPNPAAGYINILLTAREQMQLEIKLYDLTGRSQMIMSRQAFVGENLFRIDLNDLNPGIYFLRITDKHSGTVTSVKLVKE